MVGILQQLYGCTALLSFFFYFCFFKLRMGLKLKGDMKEQKARKMTKMVEKGMRKEKKEVRV